MFCGYHIQVLFDVKPVPEKLADVVKKWQVKEKKTALEEFVKTVHDIILNTFPAKANMDTSQGQIMQ